VGSSIHEEFIATAISMQGVRATAQRAARRQRDDGANSGSSQPLRVKKIPPVAKHCGAQRADGSICQGRIFRPVRHLINACMQQSLQAALASSRIAQLQILLITVSNFILPCRTVKCPDCGEDVQRAATKNKDVSALVPWDGNDPAPVKNNSQAHANAVCKLWLLQVLTSLPGLHQAAPPPGPVAASLPKTDNILLVLCRSVLASWVKCGRPWLRLEKGSGPPSLITASCFGHCIAL